MKELLQLTAFVVTLTLLVGCGMSQQEARQKLADLNIEYSKESFFERVKEEDINAAQLFLTAGIDPDAQRSYTFKNFGGDGELQSDVTTPLSIASHMDSKDMARALLEAGANPDFETQGTVESLLEEDHVYKLSPVVFASLSEHTGTVETLLEWGADPNVKFTQMYKGEPTSHTESVIYMASRKGNAEIVRALMEAGAAPYTKDAPGKQSRNDTAIFIAVKKGNLKVVRALIKSGVNPTHEIDLIANSVVETFLA